LMAVSSDNVKIKASIMDDATSKACLDRAMTLS
jgi:hypothetical protein